MVTALRIVFFGTPEFAVPTLDRLLSSTHTIVGVVTQPDRPRGRGQKVSDAPVKVRAVAAGLPILQPHTLKDPGVVSALAALGADIGVVAAYGRILPQAVLDVPQRGLINVHASLLPRYRGAAPVHRAVIAGDPETGVTIMRVVLALDAGPMLARVHRAIRNDETSEAVERDLAQLGGELLVSTLDRIALGQIIETPQNDAEATYAGRLTKEEGLVNWSRTAHEIHNQIRGLYPWPHAFTFLSGRRLILLRSTPLAADTHALPGTIVSATGEDLRIATGHGILQLTELQSEGKRPMTAREFLSGHRLLPGDRFGSQP